MTINVLVTGSRGFIGSALLKRLSQKSDVKVFQFLRETAESDLETYIKSADYVIHLAGEVRPNSTAEAFSSSHTVLTEKIINYLSKYEKKVPILMTSSIHAENPRNAYGFTKRESECLLEFFSNKSSSTINIFRLSHVFGPGCKPNYNSVLTTWIYNLINNLEVEVYDRNIQMHYVFVEDVVDQIESFIFSGLESQEVYNYSNKTHSVTLGDVIDLLNCFHDGIPIKEYRDIDEIFIEKLKQTYLSYLPFGGDS